MVPYIRKGFIVGLLLGMQFAAPVMAGEQTVDARAPYDPQNPFARILRKELAADIVYENDHALAFWDIRPRAKVHVLVIPKGPYNNIMRFIEDASPGEKLGLLNALGAVAREMGVSDTGFRLLTNTGHDGGQTVPHLHFHILGGEPVPGLAIKPDTERFRFLSWA